MYLIINGCFCCRDLELLGFYTTVKGYMKKSKIYIYSIKVFIIHFTSID